MHQEDKDNYGDQAKIFHSCDTLHFHNKLNLFLLIFLHLLADIAKMKQKNR